MTKATIRDLRTKFRLLKRVPAVDYVTRLRDRQPRPISALSSRALDDYERDER